MNSRTLLQGIYLILQVRIRELQKYRENGLTKVSQLVPFEKDRFKRELRLINQFCSFLRLDSNVSQGAQVDYSPNFYSGRQGSTPAQCNQQKKLK